MSTGEYLTNFPILKALEKFTYPVKPYLSQSLLNMPESFNFCTLMAIFLNSILIFLNATCSLKNLKQITTLKKIRNFTSLRETITTNISIGIYTEFIFMMKIIAIKQF